MAEKTVLYPFEPHHERNKPTYVRALQLARQTGARLVVFTAIPEPNEADIDQIYLHLLDLHGQYQTTCNRWSEGIGVRVQRVIESGDLVDRLREWLHSRPVDYVICQPHSGHLNGDTLRHHLTPGRLPKLIG